MKIVKRQGDVLCVKKSDDVLKDVGKHMAITKGHGYILEHGEGLASFHEVRDTTGVTVSEPRIQDGVKMMTLSTEKPVQLYHTEHHKAFTLERGTWDISGQREFIRGSIKRVID